MKIMINIMLKGTVILSIATLLLLGGYMSGYHFGRSDGYWDAMRIEATLRMGSDVNIYYMIKMGENVDAMRERAIDGINDGLNDLIRYMDYSSPELPSPPDSTEIEDRIIGVLLSMKRNFNFREKDVIRPEISNRLNELIENLQAQGKIEAED